MTTPLSDENTRVGRRQLETIAAALAERDWRIVADLADFRLMSGQQIRRLHFTGHASLIAAARATSGALRRLRDLGLILPLGRRIGGKRAGSDGFVWHLASAGRRLWQDHQADSLAPSRVATVEPSARMVAHTLTVAEVAVQLRQVAASGQLEILELAPEPSCWRSYLGPGGQRLTLKPDLFAVTAVPGSQFMNLWFIEVDMGTESRATLEGKAKAYEAYLRSGREQASRGAFPLVLWVTLDQRRAEVVKRTITEAPGCDQPIHRGVILSELVDRLTREEEK